MAKFFYEHVASGAGFSGEQFDIAAGAADVGIIDVLLSAGNGALTDDAPHVLVSTGALFAGGVTLSLNGMEVESASKGGQALNGRFFYLSVQNSNIVASNITVSGSGTINGSASFVISHEGDYMFHHVSGGNWRVNVLPQPSESHATIAKVPFASTKWDAGAVKNTIVVKQSGIAGLGEIGPHGLSVSGSYVVQVVNTDMTPNELVDVEIQYNSSNGDITLKKASKGPDFAGVVVVVGSLN